jgi:hypothetical protein
MNRKISGSAAVKKTAARFLPRVGVVGELQVDVLEAGRTDGEPRQPHTAATGPGRELP